MGLFAFVSIGILAFLADFCRPGLTTTSVSPHLSTGLDSTTYNDTMSTAEQITSNEVCPGSCETTSNGWWGCCVFPFYYSGRGPYYSCDAPSEYWPETSPWCVSDDLGSSNWAYCTTSCAYNDYTPPETKTTYQTTVQVSNTRISTSLSDNATSRASFTQFLVPRTMGTEFDLDANSLRPSSLSTASNDETNSNDNSGDSKDNVVVETILPIIGCVIFLVIVALIVYTIFRRRKRKDSKDLAEDPPKRKTRKTLHELYWNVDITEIGPFPNDAEHVNKKNELNMYDSWDEKGGSKGQQVMGNPSYESEIELGVPNSKPQEEVLYLENFEEITTIGKVRYEL